MVAEMVGIEVISGSSHALFDDLEGRRVGAAKLGLRGSFNIGYFSLAIVNGSRAELSQTLVLGDVVEFVSLLGFKACHARQDRAESEAETVLAAFPDIAAIAGQVKAMNLDATTSVDVMAAMVTQFLETKFGPMSSAELPTVAELLRRLERIEELTLGSPLQEVGEVGIREAAKLLGVSKTTVREYIESNMLEWRDAGTKSRPIFKIPVRSISEMKSKYRRGGIRPQPRNSTRRSRTTREYKPQILASDD